MAMGRPSAPTPPSKTPWLLILGIVGGGFLLCFLGCCGFGAYALSWPSVGPQAKQPFDVSGVPVPNFPARASSEFEPVEDSDVTMAIYELDGGDSGIYAIPGHGGEIDVILPKGEHSPGSLPCVVITAAGANMMQGMLLAEGDLDEQIPYAEAGYAVIAYEVDGPGDFQDSRSFDAFKKSCAGIVNGRNAIEFALARFPEIDPKRIYTAGHSSAGTHALLLAEHEPRIAGVLAYNPAVKIDDQLPGIAVRALESQMPGLAEFLIRRSPHTHEGNLRCPVFLFHAEDDDVCPIKPVKAMADRLKAAGKDTTLSIVPSGGHYLSMLHEGIPRGIEWLNAKSGKAK